MISKTRMLEAIKELDWQTIVVGLDENPTLRDHRDPKGRDLFHLCCMVDPSRREKSPSASIKCASALLERGFDIDRAAFFEGDWRATPLWHAVARSCNPKLVRFLLERGAEPNHCLFAAAFNDDSASIKRLVEFAAEIDPVVEQETPFLGAIKWSHFAAAKTLLSLGADVNFQDPHGMTALHYMLKKGSALEHFKMLIRFKPHGDLPDRSGNTAYAILQRKRSPDFRRLAARLSSA